MLISKKGPQVREREQLRQRPVPSQCSDLNKKFFLLCTVKASGKAIYSIGEKVQQT